MAKQDLVVKLLLDSGAFGNDLREAERKAQQFGDNIKNAGKSADEFSKAIGLSVGSLGKLGGILTGAGAVIAGIETFKSVMLSTHDTAKEFQGAISGFEGTLTEFKRSLASFDFSGFTNGLNSVIDKFKAFKEAKELAMEAGKGNVSFEVLSKGYNSRINQLEVDYNKAETVEDKQKAIDEAKKQAKLWEEKIVFYKAIVNQAIQKELSAGTFFSDMQFKRYLPKPEDLSDFINKQVNEWANLQLDDDAKKAEQKAYDNFTKEFTRLTNEINRYSRGNSPTAPQSYYDNLKKRDELIKKNIGLVFRNELFEMPIEALQDITTQITEISNLQNEISSANNKIAGWENSIKNEDDKKPVLGSIKELEDKIAKQQQVVNAKTKQGTKEWKDAVAVLNEYKQQLKVMQDELKKLDPDYKEIVLQAGSVAELTKKISDEQTKLNNLTPFTDEWYNAVQLIGEYNTQLNNIITQQKQLDPSCIDPTQTIDTKPLEGSLTHIQTKISELEELRNKLVVGSDAWLVATDDMYCYIEAYDALIAKQKDWAKAMGVTTVSINDDQDNIRRGIEASIDIINNFGSAFELAEDEAVRAISGITDIITTLAEGIMNFHQIALDGAEAARESAKLAAQTAGTTVASSQASATAQGVASAAGLPFPYNLISIASVVATMVSIFAKIKSMTSGKFAEGGIVGGTSYSGDKLFAMVNSGEMILNKRQQNNLANMIGGGGQVEFHISGDSLIGVLNNGRNKRNLVR